MTKVAGGPARSGVKTVVVASARRCWSGSVLWVGKGNRMRETMRDLGPDYRLSVKLSSFLNRVGTERLPNIPITDKAAGNCTDGSNRRQRPADELQRASDVTHPVLGPPFESYFFGELRDQNRCLRGCARKIRRFCEGA